MNEKQLLDLKSQIDDAKQSVSELKGQQTALLKQFKDTFKCNSIEEVDKKVGTLQKEIEKLDKQIKEHSQKLEEKYNL